MSEPVETTSLHSLTELLDELTTRHIVEGINACRAEDFNHFAAVAADHAMPGVAGAARSIAERLLSVVNDADKMRLVNAALNELRNLLHAPTAQDSSAPAFPNPQSMAAPVQPANQSLASDEDLIREFINESSDHLANIESQLLVLEGDNSSAEALHAIFRGFHTIKGLAGFLAFEDIRSLTHEVETLLDLARTSQLTVGPSLVDVLLESTDIVRHELEGITLRLKGKPHPATRVTEEVLETIRRARTLTAGSREPAAFGQNATPSSKASVPQLTAPECSDHPVSSEIRTERRAGDSASVRIDTTKLDQLMDTVGEMVIAQTLIQHNSALQSIRDASVQSHLAQLARITADVQRITTSMRMVPIGIQFQKTARLVRDLARRSGKQIVFEATGNETELDKSIAEQLSDPLLHMVRNAIDHGIEASAERCAAGKDPVARIRVSAYHQSGQIVVEVADDGRGLDREKILVKARNNGLVQAGAQLDDNEICQLIFEPGFSTADKVTDISGRGVGMDVVRRHVQKLRGRIDIQSTPGKGTTFFIRLPLTLAIIEGLVVMVGQHRYIVPIFSVREILRPTPAMVSTVQNKAEMALIRGGLLPIVRLHRSFSIEPRSSNLTAGTLIVTETEGRSFCLFVDELIGKQEVVIKSLGRRFKDVKGIAGCAILGDGRVGLILDIDGIYQGRI